MAKIEQIARKLAKLKQWHAAMEADFDSQRALRVLMDNNGWKLLEIRLTERYIKHLEDCKNMKKEADFYSVRGSLKELDNLFNYIDEIIK